MDRDLGAATVARAQAGDQSATDALIGEHLPLVYNIVGRALDGHPDTDDVVQETMLRAVDGLPGLREPARFRSWLVAIAMNQVRRRYESLRAAHRGGLQDAYDVPDPGSDFVGLTIVRLGLSGQRREVAEATRWLDDQDRDLLALWWQEAAGELSRAELASAMDLAPQHAAVRVQRMKGQLETARVVVRALAATPPCPGLADLTGPWDGAPSALWRKRIARHARDCAHCRRLREGMYPAEGLLAGLALVPVPHPGAAVPPPAAHGGPAGAAPAGRRGAHRAGPGRSGGHRRLRTSNRRRLALGAGALVVAGGTAAVLIPGPRTEPQPSAAPEPARVEIAVAMSSPPVTPPPSPSPTASPTPSAAPTAPATSARPAPSLPQQVVDLVNAARAKAGCGPVQEEPRLQSAAQGQSDDMAARQFFDHTNPDGLGPQQRIQATGYRWSSWGENIAQGQPDAVSVMDGWMNSAGHRANILNCAFTQIGVGVHKGPDGPWWTEDFASPGR